MLSKSKRCIVIYLFLFWAESYSGSNPKTCVCSALELSQSLGAHFYKSLHKFCKHPQPSPPSIAEKPKNQCERIVFTDRETEVGSGKEVTSNPGTLHSALFLDVQLLTLGSLPVSRSRSALRTDPQLGR